MKLKSYDRIGEQVFTETLSNGLKIFIIPKRGFNKSYAFFATNYGGADRRFRLNGEWTDTPMGVAHFLEHKMFDTKDGNALTDLSANGASPNAFTSSEITAYHFESTDKFFENLEILLSFVSVPYFTEESVAKEQGIIGQEIRMTEDEPDYAVYYGLMKLLYKYNPIRESVAGTVDSIAEITADTLYGCHKVFYNPSNMVLCVAGDVDPEQVIRTAEKILPREAGGVPMIDRGEAEAELPYDTLNRVKMAVSRPLFMAGFKTQHPTTGAEIQKLELTGALALEVLAGASSPLYAKMYADGLITKDFSAEFETCAGVAYGVFGGESNDPLAVRAAIIDEAERLEKNGPDTALFDRIKKSATGTTLRSLNSFDSICYNRAKAYFRGFDSFDAVSVLDSITAEDIRSFIAENISAEKLAISIIDPA